MFSDHGGARVVWLPAEVPLTGDAATCCLRLLVAFCCFALWCLIALNSSSVRTLPSSTIICSSTTALFLAYHLRNASGSCTASLDASLKRRDEIWTSCQSCEILGQRSEVKISTFVLPNMRSISRALSWTPASAAFAIFRSVLRAARVIERAVLAT